MQQLTGFTALWASYGFLGLFLPPGDVGGEIKVVETLSANVQGFILDPAHAGVSF